MNFTPGRREHGADESGPSVSAGNSFTAGAPKRTARMISVGVAAPGTAGEFQLQGR